MTGLKPCPFCGGEVSLKDMGYFLMISRANRSSCKCGVFLESRAFTRDNLGAMERAKERLIEKWNRRSDGWQTGTPTEEGWYLLNVRCTTPFRVAYMRKWQWLSTDDSRIRTDEVIAWQKITPYKEES